MKTIQIAIDEPLVADVDQVVRRLHTTRSAFVQAVLKLMVRRLCIRHMEKRQIDAYHQQPQSDEELRDWVAGQDWGDDWSLRQ